MSGSHDVVLMLGQLSTTGVVNSRASGPYCTGSWLTRKYIVYFTLRRLTLKF